MDVEPSFADVSERGSDCVPKGADPTVLQEQGDLQDTHRMSQSSIYSTHSEWHKAQFTVHTECHRAQFTAHTQDVTELNLQHTLNIA